MVKPKIACYITGGWTECGSMTRFLGKVNCNIDYRQRFPERTIGKKGKSRRTLKIQGETGDALLKIAYEDMRKHSEELRSFAAILLEDDLDNQFFTEDKSSRDYEALEKRKLEITDEIRKILNKNDMPVFFLYAIPEIEAWFIADWENTFGEEYKVHLKHMNLYFSTTFRKYVLNNVLTDAHSVEDVENYGYFGGEYKKISDELIGAFQQYSLEKDEMKNNRMYNGIINQLIKNNKLQYSKREEGVNMLNRLLPEKVASVCQHYFSKTYMELKNFNV